MPIEFPLEGACDERFTPLREAFRANFAAGREVGASLAVIVEGRTVVDLWGGYADLSRTRPWAHDTLVCVFSSTKMVTALCTLLLVDRGQIDLDAPLTRYWPELGNRGKEVIRVRQVLCHTAGLPGFTPRTPIEALYDWPRIIRTLEAEKPWWKPGTRLGYHTVTYGYLLGEVIRRVSGKTVGQFLRDEITDPLGIDFAIGLPAADDGRAAEIAGMQHNPTRTQLALAKLFFPAAMKIAANPVLTVEAFNSRAWRAAEIPAGNGHGNARSLAQLGSILANGGTYQGRQVLSRALVEEAIREQSRGRDPIAFNRPSAWGLGVLLQNKDLLLGPHSYYATGLGGSVCVMDIERGVTLAYAMNKMAELAEGDSRSIPLVQRLWECLR